ncbi:MAG: hypothetical protein DMF85_13315 [Acidobacteria bacterium]|nr:MAG: hypothetical protein DMF85_13315 [Acidobacteriota bacterium]
MSVALLFVVSLSFPASAPNQADQPTAAYYFLLGRTLEGKGKIDDAIAAHRQAIQLDPKSAELHAELAGLFARQERAPEAFDEARAALDLDPQNVEANRILGTVLAAYADQRRVLKPGDDTSTYMRRAIGALEIARRDGSVDLNTDLALARLYLQDHAPGKAAPLLRHILDDQPGFGEGYLLLAQAQEESGHPDDAIDTLKAVVGEEPTFYRAVVRLAELYDAHRQWTEAAETWSQAQKINPRNPDLVSRRITALINSGKVGDARAELQIALKARPDDPSLLYLLAQAERQAGDWDAAEATARQLQKAEPNGIRGLYVLAQILETRNRHQEAVALLQPEIAKRRGNADAGSGVALLLGTEGLALQGLKKHDEAIAAFKEAAELAPDDPLRQVLLIQSYTEARRFKDAIAAAAAAQKRFPDDTSVLYQLGAAYDRGGQQVEAEKTFRDLLQHDPLDANALNYLGYMFAERGRDLDEAVALIQRALKIDPANPSYLDSLGWAYVQQRHLDLADQPLTAAADRLPKNSVVQDHLGDLRQKQHRPADAIAAWQRALAGDGEEIDRGRIEKKIKEAQALLRK